MLIPLSTSGFKAPSTLWADKLSKINVSPFDRAGARLTFTYSLKNDPVNVPLNDIGAVIPLMTNAPITDVIQNEHQEHQH